MTKEKQENDDLDPNAPIYDSDFETVLRKLINRNCIENESNTPDFILARYLRACLDAWNEAFAPAITGTASTRGHKSRSRHPSTE